MPDSRPDQVERWDQLEQALVRSETLAAAGQFSAAVVHEINGPLEAITNLVYLVNQEAEKPDRVRDYGQQLDEQVGHLIRIARQTLSFHRSRECFQVVEATALADAALRVHQQKVSAKKIKLSRPGSSDAVINIHAGEILQVLVNLVGNALDALPENGSLSVRVRRSGDEVHLTVADNGHGITNDALPRIFEPFFTTKGHGGTGLGLAISKSIIDRHKGRIRTRSSTRAGRTGTAFRVTLPLHSEAHATV